jgi:hypothetical protein
VQVALLDQLGKLEIGHRLALGRLAQQVGEPRRVHAIGRIAGDRRAHPGYRRPGNLALQQLAPQRLPVLVDQFRHQ